MIDFIAFIIKAIVWLTLTKVDDADLRGEIILLRKENLILRRKRKTVRFSSIDRMFFVAVLKLRRAWLAKLTIVKPTTVIGWHRKLAAKTWTYDSRHVGRPPISEQIRGLVVEMKRDNPRWGARRIKGELRKLGIHVGKDAILKILKASNFSPQTPDDESWFRFLRSHCSRYWSCDFFVVDTAFLKRLYGFFIIDTTKRELVGFHSTANPTRDWLENVIRGLFMLRDDIPRFLVSDRDGIFGEWLTEFLDTCYGVRLYRTPPQTPNCNAFAERMVLSFRSDVLDHRIIFGKRDLMNLLSQYAVYFNERRRHQSIGQDAPKVKFTAVKRSAVPRFYKTRCVYGLFWDYELAA